MEQTINIFKKNISPVFPFIIQMVAMGSLFFNLYLASKLSPLVQDISLLQQRVSANEDRARNSTEDTNTKFGMIQADLNTIKGYFIQKAIQGENK